MDALRARCAHAGRGADLTLTLTLIVTRTLTLTLTRTLTLTQAEAQIVSLPFVDLQQPHRKVLKVAAQLPAEGRDILVHCKSGVRSAAACHALAAHGLSRLYNLDGGILGWARQVDPTMPTY